MHFNIKYGQNKFSWILEAADATEALQIVKERYAHLKVDSIEPFDMPTPRKNKAVKAIKTGKVRKKKDAVRYIPEPEVEILGTLEEEEV